MTIDLLYPKGEGFADPQETAGAPAGQLGPAIGLQMEGTAKEWQGLVSVLEREFPGLSQPVKEYDLLCYSPGRDRFLSPMNAHDIWGARIGESKYYCKVLQGSKVLDLDKIKKAVANRRYYNVTRFLCRIVL